MVKVTPLAVSDPPLVLSTCLITIRCGCTGSLKNSQYVVLPGSIKIPSTPFVELNVPVVLPVPMPVTPSNLHTALLSVQPEGRVSATLPVFVTTSSRLDVCWPPDIGLGLPDVGLGVTSNANVWLDVPLMVFLMISAPVPGVKMQSNGLLLPPLPAEGYEQTLMSRPVFPISDLKTCTSTVVSEG